MLQNESADKNKGSIDKITKIPEHIEGILHKLEEFDGTAEELKDYLFHEYAKQALVEDFHEALIDFETEDGTGYFEEEDVEKFLHKLYECTDEEVLAALSIPMELRKKVFGKLYLSLQEGKTADKVCEDYVRMMSERGYGIGFHTSPTDIRPSTHASKVEKFTTDGKKETLSWVIKPTEADHRDGDITRAYYSSKYRHLYKKENSRYVYIVRTEPDHRTDNNWSRASGLSVIMRLPLQETIGFVESTVRSYGDRKTVLAA